MEVLVIFFLFFFSETKETRNIKRTHVTAFLAKLGGDLNYNLKIMQGLQKAAKIRAVAQYIK